MNITLTLLIITSLSVLTMPAQAQHYSRDVDLYERIEHRLDNQRHRIRDGIKSGVLTRGEFKRLRNQQRYVKSAIHIYMYDGRLDRYEFREINNLLNNASERIYHLKHNDRYRHAHNNRHKRKHRRYYY